jgi:hypothetical protein
MKSDFSQEFRETVLQQSLFTGLVMCHLFSTWFCENYACVSLELQEFLSNRFCFAH